MKRYSTLFFIIFTCCFHVIWSQCSVKAIAYPEISFCGDSVELSAIGATTPLYNINFNDSTFHPDDKKSNDGYIINGTGQYSCSGYPPEGSHYYWSSSSINGTRYFSTRSFNLSGGASATNKLSFWMKYNVQSTNYPCEGIDLPDEGVHIQYSINNGVTWKEIDYFNPLDHPELEQWTKIKLNLPAECFTTNTQYRWIQFSNSGAGFDSWGLDDIEVSDRIQFNSYDWKHDNLPAASTDKTPKVVPTQNTYYIVTYSDGFQTCTDSVLVKYVASNYIQDSLLQTACFGDSIHLNSNLKFITNFPTSSQIVDPKSLNNRLLSSSNTPIITSSNLGTVGYHSGQGGALGNFGEAFQTYQFILRSNELTSNGLKKGIIDALSFDVGAILNSSSTNFQKLMYENFSVELGATTSITSPKFEKTDAVFKQDTLTFFKGKNTIKFQQPFYWDGNSNIIVQFCWYYPLNESSNYGNGKYAFVLEEKLPYPCSIYSFSNFSDGKCDQTSFVSTSNYRPRVTLSHFYIDTSNFNYQWIDEDFNVLSEQYKLDAKFTKDQKINLYVSKKNSVENCKFNYLFKIKNLNPTITFNSDTIYTNTSSTDSIHIQPTIDIQQEKTIYSRFLKDENPNLAIKQIDSTGVISSLEITDFPNKDLSQISLNAVLLNLQTGYVTDDYIELIAPNGSKIVLYSKQVGLSSNYIGSNFSNTCFTDSIGALSFLQGKSPFNGKYTPVERLSKLSGPVNGIWKLRVADFQRIGISESMSQLDNWSLEFKRMDKTSTYFWEAIDVCSPNDTNYTRILPQLSQHVLFKITDPLGCQSTDSVTIVVDDLLEQSPIFTLPSKLCENDTLNLPTLSLNGISGIWNTASNQKLSPGNYSFNFTPNAGQHARPFLYNLQVKKAVQPVFEVKSEYCKDEMPPALPKQSLNNLTGLWTPENIQLNTNANYTFKPLNTPESCGVDTTFTIKFNNPTQPTFDAIAPFCSGTTAPKLKLQSKEGIEGTWKPSIISNSTSATYTFSPTFNYCVNKSNLQVVVKPSQTASFNLKTSYCQGATVETLPTTSANGFKGQWTPNTISNAFTGNYIFKADTGLCVKDYTLTVSIQQKSNPSFDPLVTLCIPSSAQPQLPATSKEGYTGTWNPAVIDKTQTKTYYFTPTAGTCVETDSLIQQVAAEQVLTFPFNSDVFLCVGSPTFELPQVSNNGISGSWSPSVIFTQVAGNFVYTFTPNQQISCLRNDKLYLFVKDNVVPVFDQLPWICAGAMPTLLSSVSQNGISGTWNPSEINNQQSGDYTFTPDASEQCATEIILYQDVRENITPQFDFSDTLTYCKMHTPNQLPNNSLNGVDGTWNPSQVSTSDIGTAVYTFTPNSGFECTATKELVVQVVECVGLKENKKSPLKVYPNPTNGVFTVESKSIIVAYRVIDLSGKEIVNKQFETPLLNTHIIQLNNLSSGSYIIEFTTDELIKTRESVNLIINK